jgi:hypothetical protein
MIIQHYWLGESLKQWQLEVPGTSIEKSEEEAGTKSGARSASENY